MLKEDSPAERGEMASGLLQMQSCYLLFRASGSDKKESLRHKPSPEAAVLCVDRPTIDIRFWSLVLKAAVFLFTMIYLGDGSGVPAL